MIRFYEKRVEEQMRQSIFSVGILAALFACGDARELGRLPDPGRPYETDEVYPQQAVLVATAQWHNESIDFLNISPERDPTILTVRNGPISEGDIFTQLQQQADGVTVTPAELWRAVAESDDIPEVLVLDHYLTAEKEGRSLEYRDFDTTLLVEKSQPISLDLAHQIFPHIDGSHCWNSRKQFAVDLEPTQATQDAYVCSSSQPAGQPDSTFVRFTTVTLSTACPTSFNTTGTVRVVAVNNLIPRSGLLKDIVQVCFDVGNGWTCDNTRAMAPGTFTTSDLAGDAAHPHRIGIGDHATNSLGAITFGAARLLSSPPKSSTDGFCP